MGDFQQRILDWAKSEGLDRPRKGHKLPPRKAPTLSDKLAAALLLLRRPDGRPLIPESKRHSKAAILAHPLHWDHIIARGLEGPDHFGNYAPLDPADHKPKTKADKQRMAHNDRLRKEHEAQAIAEAVRRMLAPAQKHLLKNATRALGTKSRPMAGGRHSKYKRTMRGRTVLREKQA